MTDVTQHRFILPAHPVAVDLDEIKRQPTGSAAVALCATKSGKLDKVIAHELGIQEAVWSRCKTGQNSLSLEHLDDLMTVCGNESPLLWLLMNRNYDPHSLRVFESATEKENRLLREENIALRRVLLSGAK